MSKHVLTDMKESTRRTVRGLLQNLIGFGSLIVAIAIPQVQDAVNAVLNLLPWVNGFQIDGPTVSAVATAGIALVALVTKLQNLWEGRDLGKSPEALAAEVVELTALVSALSKSLKASGEAIQADVDRDPNPPA